MVGFRLLVGVCALAACSLGPADAAERTLTPSSAERTLTPSSAGAAVLPALTAVGVPKNEPRLDPARPWLPPPRLPAPLGPLAFGAGGGGEGAPSPISVSPPAAAAPVRAPSPSAAALPRPPKAPVKSSGKFAAWEGNCTLPEDLNDASPPAAPGTRLRARVDSFQRKGPGCGAPIRGVLLQDETVTALTDNGDGWVKVRDRWGAVYWVGARLLAPAPQR